MYGCERWTIKWKCKWSAQACPTLCDPVDCNLPGSSIHGILQARVLEWGAISFSRGSSWPRDWTRVSRLAGRCFNLWATREIWTIKLSTKELMFLNCGVGEETLESPLDCKEIQPIYPKGNQSWIFIGRTNAEAESPIVWPPDAKSWVIWKNRVVGED